MLVMLRASRSMISIWPRLSSRRILLPLKLMVALVPCVAWRASLLNTPANFMAPTAAPPVILVVSLYSKSAKQGVEREKSNNATIVPAIPRFISPPMAVSKHYRRRNARLKFERSQELLQQTPNLTTDKTDNTDLH